MVFCLRKIKHHQQEDVALASENDWYRASNTQHHVSSTPRRTRLIDSNVIRHNLASISHYMRGH